MNILRLFTLIFLIFSLVSFGKPTGKELVAANAKTTEWIVSDLLRAGGSGISILGKPEIVACKYGNAVQFNGSTDGIFLDMMPLTGLTEFTIEILLCPAKGGNFEQRYFHGGEVRGSRVMMELRSNDSDWYLDAFFKSGDEQKTLIEPTLTHPLDQWAHVAFVVEQDYQQTFVNGKKELESRIKFRTFAGGKTSLGVRQNQLSWFKGAIYSIRITPKALKPIDFIKY